MADNGMIRVAGLWVQKKGEKTYISGNLTQSAKLLIFRNENKRGEKDPDYILYLAPKEPTQQNQANNKTDDFMG